MQRSDAFQGRAQPAGFSYESSSSAVSWGAVIAGAVIGAALMATLITGGTGLGLIAVSPWQGDGVSGTTVAVGTVLWMLATQIIAYGVAGYVAGRLRTKWTDSRSDEIYFRDTAHGFLVWALSFVVGLVLFGATAASVVSGTARTGTAVVSEVAQEAGQSGAAMSMDYFADMLLRPTDATSAGSQDGVRREVALILSRSVAQGEISQADQNYLVGVISQRAGINEADARVRLNEISEQTEQAVEEVQVKAREAADTTRKYLAALSLWAFASLLLGAFVSSLAATIGGRTRDL